MFLILEGKNRMENNKLLKIENLKMHIKTYMGTVKAVDGVNIDINRGEIVGIVGESGSGKSLTSRTILKLLPEGGEVVSGKILFHNKDLLKLNDNELRNIRGSKISFIFQNPSTFLNPVLKIGDQIAENILLHQKIDKREIKNIIISVLSDVGLRNPDKIINCFPHQLSGGMQQRVMIAMAISCKPDLIIADECTTALDVTTQLQILDLLKNISKKTNISILLITHNLAVVSYLCSRVYVMFEGKTIESGESKNFFSRPQHEYTKKLLNASKQIENSKFYSNHEINKILNIENLNKNFNLPGSNEPLKAVNDLSFSLNEGEIFGIAGESGSGKTTVANLLMGLLEVNSGKITFINKEINQYLKYEKKNFRKNIQMVFQDPYGSLNPRKTIGTTLSLAIKIHFKLSEDEIKNKVFELLEKVELTPPEVFYERHPHELSGGQQQRVAIARAISTEPKLIISDEAVASLDMSIRSEILKLLKKINIETKVSMIMISHDLSVLKNMCNRIAIMHLGKIVEIGDKEKILGSPQHNYTKKLISATLEIPN
jgi:ABC-type glutathione transport system ATPase component